jgi:anhydro-N-acetylmuramic acid kinase
MSGTSVDSIDAACVEIEGSPGEHKLELRSFTANEWDPKLRCAILELCRDDAPLQKVTVLNFLVAEAFARAAQAAARAAEWELSTVNAIASHGQTIWHQPSPFSIGDIQLTSVGTMQIGEPSVIAARTQCVVVADFRVADMAVGGQGAPLVPFADYALFASNTETRAVQNIGGIGNVSYLRSGGSLEEVIAFDTGPGNILMDEISRLTTGLDYDANGAIAASGEVCRPLLERWLENPFFHSAPPKTTGREMFGIISAQNMIREGHQSGITDADVMATACALTAESIAHAYHSFLNPIAPVQCVVLGGGGTHNKTLLSMLKRALVPARVSNHEDFGIDNDAKEAMAFALLAYETLNGRPSNVPSATGARFPAILGKVVYPPITQFVRSAVKSGMLE